MQSLPPASSSNRLLNDWSRTADRTAGVGVSARGTQVNPIHSCGYIGLERTSRGNIAITGIVDTMEISVFGGAFMYKILRFEKQILAACKKHLDDVLKLLGCKIAFHVLLVGMDTESISVLPHNGYLSEAEIDEHFTPPEQLPRRPSDELEGDEWHKSYQVFDEQCSEWWRELRDAVNSVVACREMLTSVSPTIEVDGKVVALVVIFSEADCMSYPTVSMDVFTNHGRWPSLQFGAIDAVLNQFAEELDKRNPGRGRDYEPFDPQQTLRIAGEFWLIRKMRAFVYPTSRNRVSCKAYNCRMKYSMSRKP